MLVSTGAGLPFSGASRQNGEVKPQSAHRETRRLRRELAEARERHASVTRQLREERGRNEELRRELAAAKEELVARSYHVPIND